MKAYQFEVLPDGSLGARYWFDAETMPAQAVRPGATLLTVPITGREPPEQMTLMRQAHLRPQEVQVQDGRLQARPVDPRAAALAARFQPKEDNR